MSPRPTEDDLFPTGQGGRFDLVAALRAAAKDAPLVAASIIAIVTTIVGTVAAIKVAVGGAKDASQNVGQRVKNLGEDGYQEIRHTVDAMAVQLAALQVAVRRPPEPPPATARRGPRSAPRRPAPIAALPPVLKPLPATLDEAQDRQNKLRQMNLRLVTPPAAPSPDAAP